MSRRRVIWVGGSIVASLLILAVAVPLVLQSKWFSDLVRARVIEAVDSATGGRTEIGRFQFDWKSLTARIENVTLHGTEPAGKPPLFQAAEVTIGLRVVSALSRDINIESLVMAGPRVYLIILPGGNTNIPEPKVKRGASHPVEALVNLAIGRFAITNGVVEVENRGQTPFDARGRNLNARLSYEAAVPRYKSSISLQPLELNWPGYAPVPVDVALGLSIERNRIGIESATLASSNSQISLSGALENLASPSARVHYQARVSVSDAARELRLKGPESGSVQVTGDASWEGAGQFATGGTVRASGIQYRDSSVRLRDCSLEGAFTATPQVIQVNGARVAGSYVGALEAVPASGSISAISLRNRELSLRGIIVRAMNGEFRGEAATRDFDGFSVQGHVSGIEAKRAVAVYSREPIPWNAQVSGGVEIAGSLRRPKDLRLNAQMTIGPSGDGAPVHGNVNAIYDARTGVLDLGRSSLILPASRADFSGVLGSNMRVHLETSDLNDLLPALGEDARSLPVSLLAGGNLLFDGGIAGSLDAPKISGKLAVRRFRISGRDMDSLDGTVTASPENARIDKATLAWKSLRAQFRGAVSLAGWKAESAGQIFGDGTVHGAAMADVLVLAGSKDVPLSGTLNATAQFSGTVGSPQGAGDFQILKGVFHDEPFDRFAGHLNYTEGEVSLSSGVLQSKAILIQAAAAFRHPAGRFDSGRLHFQIATNSMAIEQIATLAKARPGLQGSVLVKAAGDLDVSPRPGSADLRLVSLDAEATGDRLQLQGQPLGHARLVAHSQGATLKASMTADLAESAVHGEGQWELAGDYPGTGSIQVSSFNFEQLRPWLPQGVSGKFSGSADGEFRVSGPVLKPELLKAELRLSKLNITPPPQSGVPDSMALRNSGPVVATLADSVVNIQSARLTGQATDITMSGRIRLNQRKPLELRVNGRVDLKAIHDFDHNLEGAGLVSTDVTIGGDFATPLVAGRMEFQNAAFNIVDVPNGISSANGVILFTGDRATIQRFTGETGGGKIELTGFASYTGGPLVFHVRAEAKEVRVRYPEGVSTVANASLRFTGTSDRSNLSGTVTILRTGFNIRSDFTSLIAQSAEPVQTPSARTGLLGGLNFDIQINTSPDIQFESSLTQDLQVEANLRLRGTASNPALLGRVNITHGQVIFYGSRFNVSQGSVAFYNPLKVEPILDVDLETKARGIDITLTVSGPLNKLNLTPRSDPPLQFNEIVALLATGRTPTSDPTLLAQQATAPNAWQQTGASALLGQAIASPVAGRLQRFFGVSKLRIDPTLPGVENNPQARLTLEQQVTPDITFTYITNVTSSNPLVVRVEWSLSKQWSVVALREENGVFGIDFYYRKRF